MFEIYSLSHYTLGLLWAGVGAHVSGALRWRHNERDGVSNHQPHDCLLNRLFRRRWKKTSKLHVHNGPVTRKMFPFDDVIMWWPHSTTWTFYLYKCHHHGCLNNPILSTSGLHVACWVYFMCYHELWPTSASHPFYFSVVLQALWAPC